MATLPKNILIVDDEVEIRSLLEMYLHDRPFIMHQAGNCEEAKQIIKSYPIDLVLLDISMPAEDGRAIIPECQKLPNKPKIILISAFVGIINEDPRLKNITALLPKPFTREELLAAINKVFS